MTTPISIGWPQVLLFIIAIVGLGLLISAFMGLSRRATRGWRNEEEGEEEAHKFGRRRYYRSHRHFRWGRSILGLILVLLALSLLWLTLLVQTYLGLTNDIKVARVHATSVSNILHMMSVDLTLYDQNGRQTSEQTYIINGDEWMLQGDVIKFPSWLNILGVHSGYKLTRLEGRYDDPKLESTSRHTVVTLNGGDDNFFKTVQEQAWTSPIVQAAYGSSTFLQPDGKTYDVLISQTGLYAAPEK
jgi:hypothetical protein